MIRMPSAHFLARGHPNVVADHRTTLELTRETELTKRGTCIVGVRSDLSLSDLDADIKSLARRSDTTIRLVITADGLTEEITGQGANGLTYTERMSMVVRKSDYTCGRTLMVHADKSASDLSHSLVALLKRPETVLDCTLIFNGQ